VIKILSEEKLYLTKIFPKKLASSGCFTGKM